MESAHAFFTAQAEHCIRTIQNQAQVKSTCRPATASGGVGRSGVVLTKAWVGDLPPGSTVVVGAEASPIASLHFSRRPINGDLPINRSLSRRRADPFWLLRWRRGGGGGATADDPGPPLL